MPLELLRAPSSVPLNVTSVYCTSAFSEGSAAAVKLTVNALSRKCGHILGKQLKPRASHHRAAVHHRHE